MYDIPAIDVDFIIFTEEVKQYRPENRNDFYQGKMKVDDQIMSGVSLEEMIRRMDAAGTEKAFLIAAKVGPLGTRLATICPMNWSPKLSNNILTGFAVWQALTQQKAWQAFVNWNTQLRISALSAPIPIRIGLNSLQTIAVITPSTRNA